MSSVAELVSNTSVVEEGVLKLPGSFALHFGGVLNDVRLAWRISGAAGAPVVVALGGISAGRDVFATSSNERGWWQEVVGPNRALDANSFRILG
ncbi:MAG TPA: hypothetical protein VET48_02180, partial [Steroidobacteraceae bacterium]|nr:hypothetical protein [Steroidobacteraceae bacterium]